MDIQFLLNSGKNPKWVYYLKNTFLCAIPRFIYSFHYKYLLNNLEKRSDFQYIIDRVNYYNRLSDIILTNDAQMIKENKKQDNMSSVYFYDSQVIAKYFKPALKWFTCFGDVIHVPNDPSIVKSRPLSENNENSVILKLEKVRHFIFLNDKKSFNEKLDKVIFRGKIDGKLPRIKFIEKFFDNPKFDVANVSKNKEYQKWQKEKMTLWKHLDYKFIMALEGNDVASNLKWIMSSNSIAVMPNPTCETWFMEGKLLPNIHYLEIKSDFSDLEERIQWCNNNPIKAAEIIKNANLYTQQFLDYKREKIISILVLKKYFEKTNQEI